MSEIDAVPSLEAWMDALAADDEASEVIVPRDLQTVEIGGRLPLSRTSAAA